MNFRRPRLRSIFLLRIAKPRSGFTLVEVLIALMIFSIGLLGLSAMTISMIRGLSGNKDLTTATVLAQEKMEDIKNTSYGNVTEVKFPPLEDYNTIPGYLRFKREVEIRADLTAMKIVEVKTSWKVVPEGTLRNITLKTIISP